ncbi:site-specific integrase [Sphingobacteriaceae bacterium AH-315-L07]|nr:site-specific integrase [Sphingobacteriaceae bacterium AH-315-L07]
MASSKVILYKSKKLSDGSSPLAIRIIKDRKVKYNFIGYNILPKDWNEEERKVKKSYENSKRLNNLILKKLWEAEAMIIRDEDQTNNLSSNQMVTLLKGNKKERTFQDFAQEFLDDLEKNKKFNRLSSDSAKVNNFKRFLKQEDIYFYEITESLLKKFRTYLISKRGVNETTVMNHYIVIRTLFNAAIGEGLVEQKFYPFGKHRIRIKMPETIKIGLEKEDIASIEKLQFDTGTALWHTKNVYLYSFYFAGMRISDVLRSKWSDYQNGRFYYQMGKNNKVDSIKIMPQIEGILKMYEEYKRSEADYIFPELKQVNKRDPKDEHRKIKTAVKKFNEHLVKIADLAEVDKKLTNHISRHSFGNIAGDKVSPQMLQKLYRHTDIKTTMGYQSNFIHKDADEALEAILNS